MVRPVDLTFKEWCRLHVQDKATLRPMRTKKSLVAVEMVMAPVMSDDFLGQWLVANIAHQCAEELLHPRHAEVPANYKYLAAAMHWCPNVWADVLIAKQTLERLGHSSSFAAEIADVYQADKIFVEHVLAGKCLLRADAQLPRIDSVNIADFTRQQRYIYDYVTKQLKRRKFHRSDEEVDPEAWKDEFCVEKASFLTGGPGTGKSTLAKAIARFAVCQGLRVRMSFPAARLQNEFRLALPEVTMGTVHSHFGIAVASNVVDWIIKEAPQDDDIWIIDEVERLPQDIIEHILATRAAAENWPIVLFLGDFQQVGAIGSGSLLTIPDYRNRIEHRKLSISKRTSDPELLKYLERLRDQAPPPRVLRELALNRTLGSVPTPEMLRELFVDTPVPPTILTVTNAGADDVNAAVLALLGARVPGAREVHVFNRHQKLRKLLLFPSAVVMITLNKDIKKGLMNGCVALVVELLARSVVLQLADDRIVSLPLTRLRKGGRLLEGFSLAGGYAMTIHKAQGLTLSSVVVFWDNPRAQPGLGYTALSRVKRLKDLAFIGEMTCQHFLPAQ